MMHRLTQHKLTLQSAMVVTGVMSTDWKLLRAPPSYVMEPLLISCIVATGLRSKFNSSFYIWDRPTLLSVNLVCLHLFPPHMSPSLSLNCPCLHEHSVSALQMFICVPSCVFFTCTVLADINVDCSMSVYETVFELCPLVCVWTQTDKQRGGVERVHMMWVEDWLGWWDLEEARWDLDEIWR